MNPMSNDLQILLNELDLLRNEAVFFLNEEKWKSLVTAETQKKLEKIKPTAIYVFDGNPYILFFDLTENADPEREQTIHKQVWSFDQAPLAFIVKPSEVKIYNAFAYEKRKKESGLQEIDISKEERKKQFSFWNLQSGKAWKWLQENCYKSDIQKKRVNQKLFDNIKLVREKLILNSNDLSEDDINILILRLIFIRYLIDRDVQLSSEFINGRNIIQRRRSFIDLIENPQRLNLFFGILNDKFNGVLFKETNFIINQDQAISLALVFNGEKPEKGTLFYGTDYYFEVFDFSIIPVEVISGIYESLIDEETRKLHSAVYTPYFLVEYILSNSLDTFFRKTENLLKTECKIFDPSMGSGIFLVQSYRRMVEREITLKGGPLSKNRLKEIAQNNLFGIDINPQALKVACFSIYIAILDFQDPKTILDDFPFPKLIGENLFVADFFNLSHSYNSIIGEKRIDFILGNPPWKNGADNGFHVDYLKKNKLLKVVSDYQFAQSFLVRCKDFSSSQTKSVLIVSSKAIYNYNAKNFRKYFLSEFYLKSYMDLSIVSKIIFPNAINPAMILFFEYANGQKTIDTIVECSSIKYNIYLKHYGVLVKRPDDFKRIKQEFFINHDWMFKVVLYGGVLDYRFLKELQQINYTLEDCIKDSQYLDYGDGIKLLTDYGRKKQRKEPSKFIEIEKIPIIETDSIDHYFTKIDHDLLPNEKDLWVKSGRNINLYTGNKILLKARPKNNTDIVCSFIDEPGVFREKTLGISSLQNDRELKKLMGLILSDLYSYFQFITSSSLGIFMPEIMQKEYLQFPYQEIVDDDVFINCVNDFIGYVKIQKNKSELIDPKIESDFKKNVNEIVNKSYCVDSFKIDLIDFVLKISRYEFKENKIDQITKFTFIDKADYRNFQFVIKAYADVFFSELEPFYPNEHISVEVYNLDHFIALNFVFSTEKPIEKIEYKTKEKDEWTILKKIAQAASISQLSKDIFIQKDVKGFEENSFYIIKPNEYKCWHRAMAWYDVAEIKQLIEADELEYLNENPDAI
jgi:hypothetical protein